MSNDGYGITGVVTWELHDKHGNLTGSGRSLNKVTDTGDQVYATNVCGGSTVTALTKPTGMQLGTGSTAVSKSGAGAALVTYLTTSDHTFDSGYPTAVNATGAGSTITYKCTFAPTEATSASTPITEAVIVNKTLVANGAGGGSAGTTGQTISRVLLAGIAAKRSTDILTLTWTHTLLGT